MILGKIGLPGRQLNTVNALDKKQPESANLRRGLANYFLCRPQYHMKI